MIKALSWTKKGQNLYAIEAFADTKAEVDAGDPIVGIPDSYEIEMGSSVMTANGEIAFRKSDGTWNWVGNNE